MLEPRILFEDPHLIVLSKPAGLLSQGEHRGDSNLVDFLREYLKRPYIGLIHRLDRNTSGLMVVAKRTKSAQRLTLSLQKGEIQRNYLAWLIGHLNESKTWSHLLAKDAAKNHVTVVTQNGKQALLTVQPLKKKVFKSIPVTLAHFDLQTGRSHQIRVQSAHEGFPLLGDDRYGRGKNRELSFSRLALHSYQLKFPHPMTKESLWFEDPLPLELIFD